MENQDGATNPTQDNQSSEEAQDTNEVKPTLESPQQWQNSGDLAEDFMRKYNVPNPEHSPRAVEYLVRMYKYYEGL
jgi:hypothetical protein